MGGLITSTIDEKGMTNGPLRIWKDKFGICMTRSIGDIFFQDIGVNSEPGTIIIIKIFLFMIYKM